MMNKGNQVHETVVMGVGGAGSHLLNALTSHTSGLAFRPVVVNTDAEALGRWADMARVQLGESGDPAVVSQAGRLAAQHSVAKIQEMLQGTRQLFLLGGMGGGTATGACAEIARLAIQQGIAVHAMVTTPFEWEGTRRHQDAAQGVADLVATGCDVTVTSNADMAAGLDDAVTWDETLSHCDRALLHKAKLI